MPYDLIVFDWDGTLMNSTPAITRSIQGACADLGLPVPDDSVASWVIGLGLEDAIRRAAPDLRQSDVPRYIERYRWHYLQRDPELPLFDGATELLAALADSPVLTAVATGKSRIGLERVLERTGLRPMFQATRCADETHPKPHPAMLLEISAELGVDPARVLMIGDTTHDLAMARAAGAAGWGVVHGAHSRQELEAFGAQPLFDSIAQIHRALESQGVLG